MVLTLKMISAAVCYHDGLKPAKVKNLLGNILCTVVFGYAEWLCGVAMSAPHSIGGQGDTLLRPVPHVMAASTSATANFAHLKFAQKSCRRHGHL